ncbi:MAG: YceI family protein [Saprospiraceae bacterium]|nr:YceI family protein [Saprospiraceae bacterium]
MKILTSSIKNLTMILLVSGMIVPFYAQTKFTAKSVNMEVSGTSTMHDWEMTSKTGDCTATFTLDGNGNIGHLTALNLTVSSTALKSGKGSMDKNAYKALKSDKYPNITATLKSAEITTRDNVNFTIKSVIKLTLAGKTVETDLLATAKKMSDNTYTVKGEKKISMKDYDMSPPSFMLGAVKTGNDVVLNFEVVLNQ